MFTRKVKTENGWVRGLPAADPRITSYKGIPFAAPPVGENRWRAPQPCADWDGVLDCFDFKPISMQDIPPLDVNNVYTREWSIDPDIEMSEDCLYLNVWAPAGPRPGICLYMCGISAAACKWDIPPRWSLTARGWLVAALWWCLSTTG